MTKARLLLGLVLTTAVPLEAQNFGAYAVVGDREIIIAEPVDQQDPRSLYLYRRDGSAWSQTGTLMAPPHEGGDYFGRFVAMDDRSLLVGGTVYENSTGTVWVYRRDGAGWRFETMLRPEEVTEGESFGRFGQLVGDRLFVSALGHAESRGAIWVYERDGAGAWRRAAKLTPGDEAPAGEFFGWGIAASGDRVITGALQNYQDGRGAAYVFVRGADGAWTLEHKFEGGENQNGFGQAVGWLGDRALVAAPFADQGRGMVLVYDRDPRSGDWRQSLVLTAYDRQPGGQFGAALAEVDGALWVGAPGTDGSGRIYQIAYDAATGTFGDARKLAGVEQEPGDGFGGFIAAGGDVAVVGQLSDDFGLGSAIIMNRTGSGWAAAQKVLGPDPMPLTEIVGREVACGEAGKADQFDCSRVDILSFLPVSAIGGGRGSETNDVWGWTDPQTGREYALVGRRDGTSFIDVTDPANPVFLGDLPKTPGSRGNAWRDIKVHANHAFVVADGAGEHGMQVFDLTRLRDVRNPPARFEPDALYEGIASAHNIVINEESGTAFAVGSNSGGETCGGGLHMVDIREPKQPSFIGCFQDATTGWSGTGYSHDAMCINYRGPDVEHVGKEICFGSNENFLSIADVTDKRNPIALSKANYPNVAYAHQGWITEDHRYFFMNDEGDESNAANDTTINMPGTRTLIWDVSDLDDPVMVKEHFGETLTIDHNLYIKGDLMYQSNYVSGLRVLDISDRENPREVGFLDTVPWDESVVFDGSWSNYPFFESGTIVVTSGKEGVFFVRYRRPELVP